MTDYLEQYAKSSDLSEEDATGYLADKLRGGKLPDQMWYDETMRRLNLVIAHFSKREAKAIVDFMATAKCVDFGEGEKQ